MNFFKWVVDDVVDGRDLNVERQRKNIFKLKNEVLRRDVTISLRFNFEFFTMYFK